MLSIGGIVFGIIIGYLAWYAVRLGEPDTTINLKTVTAFIGVVGGAAVIKLLPPNTELFPAYLLGLGLGFFFTPIQKFAFTYTNTYRDLKKEELISKEKGDIDTKWLSIENYIQTKIRDIYFDQYGLSVKSMDELDYALESKIYILKRFAQEHINEGFQIDDTVTKWDDKYPTHDVEYTRLQKNIFFVPKKKTRRKSTGNSSQ